MIDRLSDTLKGKLTDAATGAATNALAGAVGAVGALGSTLSGILGDSLTQLFSPLRGLLSSWTQSKRLYNVSGEGPVNDLLVEQFILIDDISEPLTVQLTALTLSAQLPMHELLGKRITLTAALSDGSLKQHNGLIFAAKLLDGDGGFQRLQVTIKPWIALLAHESHSRAWQDKTAIEIIEDVLSDAAYSQFADWRWGEVGPDGSTEDLDAFIAQGPSQGLRSLCCQYRESNLSFVTRLLAQEGLGYRIEEAPEAPAGHRVIFFADSSRWPQNLSSASATGGTGLKFQRSSATEEQDTIQAFGGQRQLTPAATAVLQWDYQAKRVVAADAPTSHSFAGPTAQDMAPWLQSYEPQGASADPGLHTGTTTTDQLQHRATLAQQAQEHRNKTWLARSTVRSLRAGQWFNLQQSTLDALDPLGLHPEQREFSVHSVHALGINNMPRELSQALAQRAQAAAQGAQADPFSIEHSPFSATQTANTRPLARDPLAELIESLAHDPELSTQAAETGYANRFSACRRAIPWRPLPQSAPTALGTQSALVVGPEGSITPHGADELYTDALGRIKVQFHWQSAPHADPRPDNRSSCWVRVAQAWAGPGMGQQFIPRIGQEVLLQFIEGNIDRPLCIGAVYNGRGEAGLAPTPGGQGAETDASAFALSSDHRPSAQGNQIGSGSGGHAPAWHGGALGPATPGAQAQNNAAAMSGVKSKEFGGDGFNQLVFDDTPGQLRVQLASTQHATQLNLGHLIHQADNHRGSYRGLGFELRTDAYGAIRATQGLLISSYRTSASDPAGDNAPGMALLKQALTLSDAFSQAAKTHQTTALAATMGTSKANACGLSTAAAPLKALLQAASGMVSEGTHDSALIDAAKKSTQAKDGKLPHSTDPLVAIAAKAGLGIVAGQDLQLASGEVISLLAGQDTHLASGHQLRVHTGQSIGILAGAVQPGEGAQGTGLTMIAGHGPVQMQAQAGAAHVAAKGLVNVQSAHSHIDWAAAKKITLATAGGASITLSSEGITTQCPGKITVKAASKSMVGAGKESYAMPTLPRAPLPDGTPFKFHLLVTDVAGPQGVPMANVRWRVVKAPSAETATESSEKIVEGVSGANGKVSLTPDQEKLLRKAYDHDPNRLWLVFRSKVRQVLLTHEKEDWTDEQRRDHALDAMGYADTLGASGNATADRRTQSLGRKDHKAATGAALFNKLKS